MAYQIEGHPREPSTFTFSETTTGPNGARRVILSYVAFDSRWPWWRKALVKLVTPFLKEPDHG